MKLRHLFENLNLTGLKVSAGFLDMEWKPQDQDRDAAWELYVELLTRVTTQALPKGHGTEISALNSVYSIFPTTREILKKHGRETTEFAKVAVIVLNQVVRPFTAKWHPVFEVNAIPSQLQVEFRTELEILQSKLVSYGHLLSQIAGVEDLTEMENV